MPVSSTANSVLWQKQKQTNKKKYIQLTRSWCLGLLFYLVSIAHPKVSAEFHLWGDFREMGGIYRQDWEATLRRLASPGRSLGEAKLGQWCSDCAPQTSSTSITWERVRNAGSQGPPWDRNSKGGGWARAVSVSEPSGWFRCMLRFENHRTRGLDTDCTVTR